MAKVVFSYSHVDETLRNELEKHLSPLKRQGLIETWHDRRIVAGQEFNNEIGQHFEDAELVLLLVSPDFINSDYCYDVEMVRAVERHNLGLAIVIPVILRVCHWHDLPFGKLLAATPDGKAVTQYPSLDEGFFHVVSAIKGALNTLPKSTAAAPAALAAPPVAAPVQPVVTTTTSRSSNLRIKKEFTDRERDCARAECFEFVAKYFANSLEELKQRNPDIEVNFRQIDANSFDAAIYVSGKRRCGCGIWMGGRSFGGDILFSHSGVSQNSFNESMSIQDDGYSLGFKPLGFAHLGRDGQTLLNYEGVAEYFWEMLIQPLQR
ncbi:hypothetical protein AZOA_26620 [Azoarcus sp. Aa7]|nr:hypothetical protein [Azoarcus sp. Aa7]